MRLNNISTKNALIIAMTLGLAACTGADLQDKEADEKTIRALLATNAAATNRRDAEGVVETYLPDGDLWIVGHPRLSGVEEIRRNEEEFYSKPGFQSWEGRIDTIRFLSSDVAIAEGSGMTTLDSGEIEEQFTWVVSRRDSGWRIAAVRIMVFREQID
jgi:uncharacterized protein (TIGR02246 family)